MTEFLIDLIPITLCSMLMYWMGFRDGRRQVSEKRKPKGGPYEADVSWRP